ncbi:MAG: hypothetical protein U0525_01255 [Patescibacteria group bacterium]
MDSKTKKILIITLPILTIVIGLVVGYFVLNKQSASSQAENPEFIESQDDQEAIPTVTNDVKVSLESIVPKKEIMLKVAGVPQGTKSIEYELTYSTKDQESQGVFSTAKPEKGSTDFGGVFERKITLGTCSKNVCKYHDITSDIKVSLKFEGSFGARMYQGSFKTSSL